MSGNQLQQGYSSSWTQLILAGPACLTALPDLGRGRASYCLTQQQSELPACSTYCTSIAVLGPASCACSCSTCSNSCPSDFSTALALTPDSASLLCLWLTHWLQYLTSAPLPNPISSSLIGSVFGLLIPDSYPLSTVSYAPDFLWS